jgi:hypothetical protein
MGRERHGMEDESHNLLKDIRLHFSEVSTLMISASAK